MSQITQLYQTLFILNFLRRPYNTVIEREGGWFGSLTGQSFELYKGNTKLLVSTHHKLSVDFLYV